MCHLSLFKCWETHLAKPYIC